MSGIGKNLYPPVVPTYQTPFIYSGGECRIYFSFPSYNNEGDFSKEIQVTISTQNDNRSALSKSDYPNGIAGIDYQIDPNIRGDNKYYIKIDSDDIEKGFSPDTYYKVQIRFSKAGFSSRENSYSSSNSTEKSLTQKYLNSNLENFSEWSTITLVKAIYNPSFILRPFSSNDENKNIIFSTGFQTLSGTLKFINTENEIQNSTTEYLKSYRIFIYKRENDENGKIKNILYEDSGELFPINKNEVYYNITKKMDNKSKYSISLELYTNNGYIVKQYGYNFSIYKLIEAETDANITVDPDIENGRAKVNVSLESTEIINNFVIRRSSSKSDFLIWEDIHYCSLNSNELSYEWYDYTLESGVLYQYAIQRIDIKNNIRNREKIATDENNNSSIIMLPLEDIFLTRAGMQFKVKFDPNISSFKMNYLETKTETLGSKYPFIRRNGNIKYKEFPISGLITAFCDEEGLFLNKNNLYKEQERIYYDDKGVGYNATNRITARNDFVYEKLFRDKIIEFLQEDSIKLFRSQTEGNVLVKLMNINFTPNQVLGRMLYSFSATAIEVADCSIENYNKYGIQFLKKENLKEETESYFDIVGQLNINGTAEDLVNKLKEKYSGLDRALETSVEKVKWIKLTFNSKPYLIQNGAKVENVTNTSSTFLGYLIKINGNTIMVNKNGIYELKGDDVNIQNLEVLNNSHFTLDYVVNLKQISPNINKPTFSKRILSTNIGQIHDTFKPEEYFVEKIRSRYIITNNPNFRQSFVLLNDITIEADSGTILYVLQKDIDKPVRHEIGKTNILKLKDEYGDNILSNFYFNGVHLYKKSYDISQILLKVASATGETQIIPCEQYSDNSSKYPYILKVMDKFGEIYIAEDEFLDLSSFVNVNDTKFIKEVSNNCVYKIGSSKRIYYKNKWYKFINNTVQCPVTALIDYTYDLIREVYQND